MAGRNLWTTLQQEVRGGPLALYLFIMAVFAFIIGCILSIEDFMSSYYGLQMLEQAFGIQASTWSWVLVVMAATPWVGQIIFFGLWTLDTSRRWAFVAATIWFSLDFISDVQMRSAGTFIPLDGSGIQYDSTVIVASLLTFLFFTVGAELFITAGTAMILALFGDAVREYVRIRTSVRRALQDADKQIRDSQKPGQSGSSGGGSNQNGNRTGNPRQQSRQQGSNRPLPPPAAVRDTGNGFAALDTLLSELDDAP